MTPNLQGARLFTRWKSAGEAFSLVELILVTAAVSLLLALAAPGFVTLGPTRKSGLHELAGFLRTARAEAVASGQERIVVFADDTFPGESKAWRAYALFGLSTIEEEDFFTRISPWKMLPKGLLFARGEHFEVADGSDLRTLHDLPRFHSFPTPAPDGSDGTPLPLPCLIFGPDGGVREPVFSNADALHVGVVEGFVEPGSGEPTFTSMRSRSDGAGTLPNGDCLQIGHLTGRVRLLTD